MKKKLGEVSMNISLFFAGAGVFFVAIGVFSEFTVEDSERKRRGRRILLCGIAIIVLVIGRMYIKQ